MSPNFLITAHVSRSTVAFSTWHDPADHKLDEVDLDSFILFADEFEETLGVGRISAVFLEARRRHHAGGIVHAAANRDLASAEHLRRRKGGGKE